MTSMIERLIGDPVARKDAKRILPIQRPLPERTRDVLEVFSALAGETSWESLRLSMALMKATPAWMIFVVLNRWPTIEEIRAEKGTYRGANHMRKLLHGMEFRRLLAQRIMTAYPEKIRLLWVRIPHCAGRHFLTAMQTMHPVFPHEVTKPKLDDSADYLLTLGRLLGRFIHTRTLLLFLPKLAPFYGAAAVPPVPETDALLPWTVQSPPYRSSDRLFTIVRDPAEIILGQVNSIAASLRDSPGAGTAELNAWRKRLRTLPGAGDQAGWLTVARSILMQFEERDPICTALGDGTCAGALEACAITNIEIADLSRYSEWILRTWDTRPEPPLPSPPPILGAEDISGAERARLEALTQQDRPFYARIRAALDGADLASVRGGAI